MPVVACMRYRDVLKHRVHPEIRPALLARRKGAPPSENQSVVARATAKLTPDLLPNLKAANQFLRCNMETDCVEGAAIE